MRNRLTYANVMATLAVFIALGGAAYAANTVGSSDVIDNSLLSADLKNNQAVKSADVQAEALTGADMNQSGVDTCVLTVRIGQLCVRAETRTAPGLRQSGTAPTSTCVHQRSPRLWNWRRPMTFRTSTRTKISGRASVTTLGRCRARELLHGLRCHRQRAYRLGDGDCLRDESDELRLILYGDPKRPDDPESSA